MSWILAEGMTEGDVITLLGSILTCAVAVFAVNAASKLAWQQQEKRMLGDYINVLNAVRHELGFLDDRFGIVVEMLRNFKTPDEPFTIPIFDIFPEYLEDLKLEVAKNSKNISLVKGIAKCHFDVCVIRDRLKAIRTRSDAIYDLQVDNDEKADVYKSLLKEQLTSVRDHCKRASKDFAATLSEVDKEMLEQKREYEGFFQKNPVVF